MQCAIETKKSETAVAHVNEALQKNVGPEFELGHWSFISCRLSPGNVCEDVITTLI